VAWATLPIDEARGFVDTHSAMIDGDLLRPQENPTDRLQDLISSFLTLRHNNRALVKQLRGSIDELRTLRRHLQQQPHTTPANARDGSQQQDKLMKHFGLTRREAQVASLLSQGRSNQAIARELDISEHTARHHTQRILAKLEVHSRGEAGAKIRG
jgi:DNA-binding CsgD family transcriptional regulator